MLRRKKFKNTLKKVFLCITFVITFSSLFPSNTRAQAINPDTPMDNNVFCIREQCPGVTTNCGFFGATLNGINQTIQGVSYSKTLCVMEDSKKSGDSAAETRRKVRAYINKNNDHSLFNVVNNTTAFIMDQRPASGVDFLQQQVYALQNFGRTFAQENNSNPSNISEPNFYYPGRGEDLLRPIQAFWGWAVNFVFSFLIVLIIFISLSILLGDRIPGATKVTISNSIPSIAIALILVPLSYAISGLFIDFITLGTNAAHSLIIGRGSPGESIFKKSIENQDSTCGNFLSTLSSECQNRGLYADDPRVNVFNIRDRIDVRESSSKFAESAASTLKSGSTGGAIAVGIFDTIGAILKLLPGDESVYSEYAWFGNVINIFIGLATFWTAIKILWKLLMKYVVLTFLPVFSPFIFATVALPNTKFSLVEKFIRQMLSASLFYVVTYSLFLVTMLLTDSTFQSKFPSASVSTYVPPLTGLDLLLSDVASKSGSIGINGLIFTLMGLIIYFNIPKILENVDSRLNTAPIGIPAIVKDAFSEFRGGLQNTALLTGSTGKLTYQSAKFMKNLPSNLSDLKSNLQAKAEKLVGISQYDRNSVLYNKQLELNKKYQQLQNEYDRLQEQYLDPNTSSIAKVGLLTQMGYIRSSQNKLADDYQKKYGLSPRGSGEEQKPYFTYEFRTSDLSNLVKPNLSTIVLTNKYFLGLNTPNEIANQGEIQIGSIKFEFSDKKVNMNPTSVKYGPQNQITTFDKVLQLNFIKEVNTCHEQIFNITIYPPIVKKNLDGSAFLQSDVFLTVLQGGFFTGMDKTTGKVFITQQIGNVTYKNLNHPVNAYAPVEFHFQESQNTTIYSAEKPLTLRVNLDTLEFSF